MYRHEITRTDPKVSSQRETEQGKYRLTIYAPNGTPVFQKEYDYEKQARNGTIEFMYNGPNLGPSGAAIHERTGKGIGTEKHIAGLSPRDYLGYNQG